MKSSRSIQSTRSVLMAILGSTSWTMGIRKKDATTQKFNQTRTCCCLFSIKGSFFVFRRRVYGASKQMMESGNILIQFLALIWLVFCFQVFRAIQSIQVSTYHQVVFVSRRGWRLCLAPNCSRVEKHGRLELQNNGKFFMRKCKLWSIGCKRWKSGRVGFSFWLCVMLCSTGLQKLWWWILPAASGQEMDCLDRWLWEKKARDLCSYLLLLALCVNRRSKIPMMKLVLTWRRCKIPKVETTKKKQGGTKNHPYFFVCFLGVWAILLILTIYRSNQKPRPKNSPKKTQPPFFRLCGLAHVLRQQPWVAVLTSRCGCGCDGWR